MAMDLKNLIEKVKKDGIEEAERQKSEILKKAEEEAAQIKNEAEKEKKSILDKAEKEAEKMQKNAEDAMKQAARDLILSLRDRITVLFDGVVKHKVSEELGSDNLKEIVITLAEKFIESEGGPTEILLNEQQKKDLEESLLSSFQKKLSEGVEIKADKDLKNGFKIGKKGTHSFYDFSDEAVSEAFYRFLNPMIRELLKKESGSDSE